MKGREMVDWLLVEYYFDLKGFAHKELFNECLYVWEVLARLPGYLERQARGMNNGTVSSGAYIENKESVFIGEGSVVEPGAYIKGPCIIGKNCVVRHGAYIRGNFICGDSCVIGHDTEIKQAVFLNGVHAAHFAYLGDSVLGNGVNLGAGTKCANLRLDRANVQVRKEGGFIDTGMHKLGAVMGDGVQTGCNSVMNPGVFLGKDVVCHPNTTVSGFVPSNHVVSSGVKSVISKR
jgi:NDP-sugar pyrophosphorylase family protein